MKKTKTRLEKFKVWLDENPKIKSALNTFWTGFFTVFLFMLKDIDWNNLTDLMQGGAIFGLVLAAVRAGLIAGVSAVGKFLTSK